MRRRLSSYCSVTEVSKSTLRSNSKPHCSPFPAANHPAPRARSVPPAHGGLRLWKARPGGGRQTSLHTLPFPGGLVLQGWTPAALSVLLSPAGLPSRESTHPPRLRVPFKGGRNAVGTSDFFPQRKLALRLPREVEIKFRETATERRDFPGVRSGKAAAADRWAGQASTLSWTLALPRHLAGLSLSCPCRSEDQIQATPQTQSLIKVLQHFNRMCRHGISAHGNNSLSAEPPEFGVLGTRRSKPGLL